MTDPPREGSERDETPFERADRNLAELLNELRVALPGVQVLFAFLLTVPFTQRFDDLSDFEEKLYFGVLICVAVATVLLVAPTVGHAPTRAPVCPSTAFFEAMTRSHHKASSWPPPMHQPLTMAITGIASPRMVMARPCMRSFHIAALVKVSRFMA